MKPGVYSNIPFDEYLKIDALSSSGLKALMKSPAHFKASKEEEGKGTSAKKMGSAIHTALLEPKRYSEEYVIAGDEIKGNSKAAREQKAAYYQEFGEDQVLTEKEGAIVRRVREAAESNHKLKSYLERISDVELTVVFEYRGVLFKCRYDAVIPEIILDLKTALTAEPTAFYRKAILKYRYDIQSSLYLLSSQVLGLGYKRFIFLAIEKTKPYGISFHEADMSVHKSNHITIKSLIEIYKQCQETDHWPCYEQETYRFELPEYLHQEGDFTTIGDR